MSFDTKTAVSVESWGLPRCLIVSISVLKVLVLSRGGWSPNIPPKTKTCAVVVSPVARAFSALKSNKQTEFLENCPKPFRSSVSWETNSAKG